MNERNYNKAYEIKDKYYELGEEYYLKNRNLHRICKSFSRYK